MNRKGSGHSSTLVYAIGRSWLLIVCSERGEKENDLEFLERKHIMAEVRFDDYYAIIPHPMAHCILFLKSDTGWTLPKATVSLSPVGDWIS